jgi:hypothetical protein
LPLYEGLNTQVIVITSTVGGAAGFTLSWFSVGASLVAPPLLLSALLVRSVGQQITNHREYSDFKNRIESILGDEDLKETIRAFFVEGEDPIPNSGRLEIKPIYSDKSSALKHDFKLNSGENFEEFIKAKMKDELGLIENPSESQLEEIIHRRSTRRPKGKTVFFRDFIDEIPYESADLSDSDIIDAEILEEAIRIKSDNEL